MLLKSQRNFIFEALLQNDLQPTAFEETVKYNSYSLRFNNSSENLRFYIESVVKDNKPQYSVTRKPGYTINPEAASTIVHGSWENVRSAFRSWALAVKTEAEIPDLWFEATKTAELFAPTATQTDDKFTRAELGAVQGQLRMLENGFEAATLPEEAQLKLIEIAQTAATKAELLTKKDWQNWIIGSFISAIIGLGLTPVQAQDVLALIRVAFGGLFLNE